MVTFLENLEKQEPEVCEYIDHDENIITIEIVLPGVRRENITLKVTMSSLVVSASSSTIKYAKYLFFKHPVVPERGRAFYEHGLLRVKIPLRA
ncbi:MAG TPA: Hsp20/alpha crystallin family protein [bacterium]